METYNYVSLQLRIAEIIDQRNIAMLSGDTDIAMDLENQWICLAEALDDLDEEYDNE